MININESDETLPLFPRNQKNIFINFYPFISRGGSDTVGFPPAGHSNHLGCNCGDAAGAETGIGRDFAGTAGVTSGTFFNFHVDCVIPSSGKL